MVKQVEEGDGANVILVRGIHKQGEGGKAFGINVKVSSQCAGWVGAVAYLFLYRFYEEKEACFYSVILGRWSRIRPKNIWVQRG